MAIFGIKTRRDREWEEVRDHARDDLVTLGDDIRALDVDAQMPDAKPDAKQRYDQAVEAYTRANQVFERARRPEDLSAMTSALEEGRYAMECAKALFEGRQPPERRPPCFFDPRHGPSTEDVEWAPPGGAPRQVPACAADALRLREGFDPHSRQVVVDGRPTEYWNAPGYYGPWAGGYFSGFGGGGLLPGLLVGSLLGGSLGFGMGEMFGGAAYGDYGDYGDGGDWGGADYGGDPSGLDASGDIDPGGGFDSGGDFGGFDGGGFDF